MLAALLSLTVLPVPTEGLAELLAELRQRDEAAQHLFLPYRARSQELVGDEPAWEERGWWLYSGATIAYGMRTTSRSRDEAAPRVEAVHGIWNGEELHQLRSADAGIVPSWEQPAAFAGDGDGDGEGTQAAPPAEHSVSDTFDSDELQRAHSPGMFGLRFVHRPWSRLLSDGRKRELLGHSDVDGRTCLAVLFDLHPTPADVPGYRAPAIAFFDVESLLAVRVQIYAEPAALEQFGATEELLEPHLLVVEDRPWAIFQEWSVSAVAELQPGLHVPLAGRLAYPACPKLSGAVLELEASAASAGSAPPAHLLELKLPAAARER